MKNIWKNILLGIAVAIGGLLLSIFVGDSLNGMDYSSACVLGIGMYMCVVIVTCTGVIVSKLEKK